VTVAAVLLAVSALGFLIWATTTCSPSRLAWLTSIATILAVVLPGWGMSAAMLMWVARSRRTVTRAHRSAEPAYQATIREIHQRTKVLTGRQQELAAITSFATGTDGYRWLAGEAWAGKTALLAEAAIAARNDVDVIAYFASRREADADSWRFVEAAVPQLAWLLGEDRPAGVREQFRALWQRAAARAEAKSRHLLLIVDGLDEDLRPPGFPSIAAELPAGVGGRAHVLVSSRLHYQLPTDLPPGHPLNTTRPRVVAPFAGAPELAVLARQEIDDLLRRDDDGLAADVLGLLGAAAGPLAVQDLASLTIAAAGQDVLRRRIRRLLTVSGARSFQVASPAGPRGTERFQFAHESLLEYAQAHEELNEPEFLHRIHQWADSWRAAGWPAPLGGENGTPQYLLDAYTSALIRDPRRLSELAGDITWAEAAIASTGVDRVLANLRRATGVDPGSATVAALLATVAGQALNLQPSQTLDSAGYILRQLWMQAAELGSDGMLAAERLAIDIRGRLQSLPGPNLVPCWTTRKTSQALSGELGRHDSFIRAMEVLADGKLAVADDDHVLIWDPAHPGASPVEMGSERTEITEVILADGRIITAQADGRRLLHDPARPETEPVDFGGRRTPGTRYVRPVKAALPDGRVVKSGLPDRLYVFEPGPGYWRGREMSCAVTALAALPDGRAVIGMEYGSVGIWETGALGAWPVELGSHDDQVSAIAVLPDGRIVTGSYDQRILLWDIDTRGRVQSSPGGADQVSALRVTDDRRLITATHKSITRWDWDSHGPRAMEETLIDGAPLALALLPDKRVAIAGPDNKVNIWDPACHVWDPARGVQPVVELGHINGDFVAAVAVLPDGRVVTGGYDGCVLLWDPDHPGSRATVLGLTDRRVLALAVLPDGRVVSSGTDGRVLVWAPAQRHDEPVVLGRHDGWVGAVAALPDGRIVTGGWDDGRVLLWEAGHPGSVPVELGRHDGHVQALAVLADGKVASSGSDWRVLVYDPATVGTPVLHLSCPVVTLGTAPHGQATSDLVVAHRGGGFSLWSVT
jgi:WD40 repeat protein